MPASPTGHSGIRMRGLNLTRQSKTFNGAYGRIFRALPPADYGDDTQAQNALKKLGAAMMSSDGPKDGPDPEESGVPAAYTYFGQFIDHDLTFDPASSLQRQDDPDGLIDFRTPRFDLDNLYGRGPDDQPYLYADGKHLVLGEALDGQALGEDIERAQDLARSGADPARAIIGDPRNDENVIVSQLQGLMLRLHNRLADHHRHLSFGDLQRMVRFHYQWVVLNDFLPTIVSAAVLDEVLPHQAAGTNPKVDPPRLDYYNPRHDSFMPLEFSVAAYRFGHSMIRPGYRLNDAIGPLAIFPPTGGSPDTALTGFRRFPPTWAIDWGRFIDLEDRPYGDANITSDPGNPKRTQLAYKIDTSLVGQLGALPATVAPDPPPSLAERNLLRGWRLRLPSGQDVARAMGVPVLDDDAILIGQFTGDQADIKGAITDVVGSDGHLFKGNCPLWTYVLAETIEETVDFKTAGGVKPIPTRKLGPVGGRIVAETFAGIMAGDSSSYLNQDPLFEPDAALVNADGKFGLRELIKEALRG